MGKVLDETRKLRSRVHVKGFDELGIEARVGEK